AVTDLVLVELSLRSGRNPSLWFSYRDMSFTRLMSSRGRPFLRGRDGLLPGSLFSLGRFSAGFSAGFSTGCSTCWSAGLSALSEGFSDSLAAADESTAGALACRCSLGLAPLLLLVSSTSMAVGLSSFRFVVGSFLDLLLLED